MAIRTERLGKKYHVGVRGTRITSFREMLTSGWREALQAKRRREEFWALRNVDLTVGKGERVGVIGRNGAGKSTLLKLLSRITAPSEGQFSLSGRVASLLEVGTGFHPELTGRENIFLNGAILGMSKVDIRRRFDAIVDFAEIERFLETPVKRYSSGMYVRLAFAVAAHLEPDILIVDEVLAVGDAQFQQKCIGKLGDIGSDGRTILVVSHNMALVNALCARAVLLSKGSIIDDGPAARVTQAYFGGPAEGSGVLDFRSENVGSDSVKLLEVRMHAAGGQGVSAIDIDAPVFVSIRFQVKSDLSFKRSGLYPQINLSTALGETVFASLGPSGSRLHWPAGEYVATVEIPAGLLNAETYSIAVGMGSCDAGTQVHFYQQSVATLTVTERILDRLEIRSGYGGHIPGVVRPTLKWNVETTPAGSSGV